MAINKEIKHSLENGKEINKTIVFKITFIDSARFIQELLWNVINNLIDGLHKNRCK